MQPRKKIAVPQPPEKVIYKTVQLSAPPENPGVIEARDGNTGKKMWELQVYEQTTDPTLEHDVQLRFITQLEIKEDSVHVTDDSGKKYTVDLSSY